MTAARKVTEPSTDVRTIADSLVELIHLFQRAKARLAEDDDVEWSAHVLLRQLATDGPMRSGALADILQFDPSTVSRQVATLVKQGMLRRQADPEDGRACLLVLTPRAHEVVAEQDDRRLRHFASFLQRWDTEDLQRLAELFPRFVRDFDAATARWLADRLSAGSERTAWNNTHGTIPRDTQTDTDRDER